MFQNQISCVQGFECNKAIRLHAVI